MRFGKPANSLALAPMDIREERMRFSATEISFGKAPLAMGVTAMWIAARGTRSALPAAEVGVIPKYFGGTGRPTEGPEHQVVLLAVEAAAAGTASIAIVWPE